ncbi:hypothetical protein [Kribbella solani]|uniref:Uncharacterized protein n=1 Tax=Kribbella solani TaxID=236067 RepID=A0A841DUZ1_9ACTN|nr:hypothetical protein [Kribbella solani]MBB5982432.1 hypothetical protein [Kribbella solani]
MNTKPKRNVLPEPGSDEFIRAYRRMKRQEASLDFVVMWLMTTTCIMTAIVALWMLLIVAASKGA